MDLHVQDYLIVKMVKSGMFILIAVSVLITCFGIIVYVKIYLFVRVEEYLILLLDVFALKENSGMDQDVHFQIVLVDKFGMEPNVSVLLVEISMEQFVLNVLMVNNGIIKIKLANAHLDTSGLELHVLKHMNAVEIEFGIRYLNTVFVQKENIGMEDNAQFDLNVQVAKNGIKFLSNANVQVDQNGIPKNANFVGMDKFGMNLQENVCAQEVQFGMIIFAELFSNAMEG